MTGRLAALWVGLTLGCAGRGLRHDLAATQVALAKATAAGAQQCAPVALATAEAHLEFAEDALARGALVEARPHAAQAEAATHEALAATRTPLCRAQPNHDADADGVADADDACPRVAEDRDEHGDADGCPDPDNDGDGLTDARDRCPDAAEDLDNWEDADGCPDDDNDQDQVPDKVDRCAAVAEDRDGYEDGDGCPDCDDDGDGVLECPTSIDRCPNVPGRAPDGCPRTYQHIVVTQTHIELRQTIFFDTRKTSIKPISFPLLDEVVTALQEAPTLKVRIEGHTDSQGNDRQNLRLSQGRADAVRAYLVRQGVAANRLTAQGFGETTPIADNRTQTGRSQNRRVEFVILER